MHQPERSRSPASSSAERDDTNTPYLAGDGDLRAPTSVPDNQVDIRSKKVSIIVPTLNRSALLQKALVTFCRQTFPVDEFEIIVVDNGSTDETREIVRASIRGNRYHQIRYVYEPEPGLLAGRHRGALEGVGDFYVFVDDDIEAVPGWLQAIVSGFDDPRVQLIGGRNLPNYEVDPPRWVESFWGTTPHGGRLCWYLSLVDLGEAKLEINPNYIFGLNFAIRRQTFYDLGGFHRDYVPDQLQQFQGDGESGLSMPAETRGDVAAYQPGATVYHFVPSSRMTPEYFERRAFLEGVGDSYADVRRNHGLSVPLATRARRFSDRGFRHVKQLGRTFLRRHDVRVASIHRRVERARQAGFEFHQRAIRADPNVLRWVLRPNYWDYRLPR